MPEFLELQKIKTIQNIDQFYYPSNLWARILFSFAVAYKNNGIEHNKLLEALIPFYHSRVLSYVNHTRNLETRESEEYLENINRIFESEKYYLLERWNEHIMDRKIFR